MTGLFFGSFNPVHLGHTALAKYLLQTTDLNEIWFVVSPHNPLKEQKDLWDDEFRLKLVEKAIADEPHFRACDVEFSLPTPSYTVNTLRYLSKIYPQKQFSLIIGADNLMRFNQWVDYQFILENYCIIVYPREGVDLQSCHTLFPQVKVIDAPLFPVSSTEIRKLIGEKKDVSRLLHPVVWQNISEKLKK